MRMIELLSREIMLRKNITMKLKLLRQNVWDVYWYYISNVTTYGNVPHQLVHSWPWHEPRSI
jgi:hypothetical protein